MARILFFSGKVEDDRGNRFRMSRENAWSPDSISYKAAKQIGLDFSTDAEEELLNSALIRRSVLRRKTMTLGRIEGHIHSLVILSLFAALLYFSVDQGVCCGAPFLVFIALYCWAIVSGQRQFARWTSRLPSLSPVCIVCIYDLSHVPAESDGLTVCPECGAAWDLSRKGDR